MKIKLLPKAQKSYIKLPPHTKKKARKALNLLISNPKHPSLNIKKKKGHTNIWEARIDLNYRLTYFKEKNMYVILTMGPHDVGLGEH